MNIILLIFRIILFTSSREAPENPKEKHSLLPLKMNILLKEIWQLLNVRTAFFLSTAVLCRWFEGYCSSLSCHFLHSIPNQPGKEIFVGGIFDLISDRVSVGLENLENGDGPLNKVWVTSVRNMFPFFLSKISREKRITQRKFWKLTPKKM